MMKLQEIPRLRVGQELTKSSEGVGLLERERMDLATMAKNLLGYRALSAEINGSTATPVEELGTLAKALLVLDYEVLDATSVFAYQCDEACRRTKEELNRLSRGGQIERVFSWGFAPAKWEATDLKMYGEPIPEFVLDKAIKIKQGCPEVTFRIHHLNDPKADPFLVAILTHEVYFIEAWEEPRFEGRVTR